MKCSILFRKKKRYFYIYTILLLLLLSASFRIIPAQATQENPVKKSADNEPWQLQLKKFATIYGAIKAVYPEDPDIEKVFFASISGLLKTLDPHSYFLDPLMVRSLNEDQQGNYYGIGTRITKYEDRLTVVAPIKDTPAYRLGIRAGDIIAEIEGKDTRHISLDDSMAMLRGAKGSFVSIKIKREGIKELLPFKINREEIPLNSISYSLVLPEAPEIGFISIRTFGNTTAKELETNIQQLVQNHHIKGLILDLRGNAGGSLYAAIDVADFFLPKDTVVVSVKGRTFNRSFTAKKNNQFESLPLAVLINRGSASASEIVASALQDNKRATIIGSRSWGKGLVQTVTRLSLNSSLALTTAKYYTPNNNCIQRDFDERDDYFFFVNHRNYETDTSIEGGVIPDIPLPPEYYSQLLVGLISHGVFFNFARQLIDSGMEITTQFTADENIIEKFRQFLDKSNYKYTREKFDKQTAQLKIEIEREVVSGKFSQDEGVKVFLKSDTVTQKAVEVLKKKYE